MRYLPAVKSTNLKLTDWCLSITQSSICMRSSIHHQMKIQSLPLCPVSVGSLLNSVPTAICRESFCLSQKFTWSSMKSVVFCIWLLLRQINFLRFIQVVCTSDSFSFLLLLSLDNQILFNHSHGDGHWVVSSFRPLWIKLRRIFLSVSLWTFVLTDLGYIPWSAIAGSGTSQLGTLSRFPECAFHRW